MPRRILVVDDNRDSADSLARLLELMGHQTTIAYDGPSAVDSAESFRPEVALLDVGLPGIDGYEVCRRIRAQEWGKDIVLIAATGWGQPEDRRRSREAGFDHHMVKPIALDDLERFLV
jgi:CheY-like chemotaxis protein